MVKVVAEYLDAQSNPDASKYVFAYHITVMNQGDRPATLMTRHWIITDGDQEKQEVHGTGVVGQTPTIQAGEDFQYTSGVVLDTPVGIMEGSYQMVDHLGAPFDIPIKPFLLSAKHMVH
ncbi:MAG: Co2+/Mg2+ efflux protein ApaG [Porticoccaceae bacterium]|nr:Co2+/Mg2+ efflux protein ApaG [Porticoccaceae bacterium]